MPIIGILWRYRSAPIGVAQGCGRESRKPSVHHVRGLSSEEIEREFLAALQSIRDNYAILAALKIEDSLNTAFYVPVMAALSLKHSGFSEEREWRMIFLPDALPSEHVERSVEVIDGVPQAVFKIPIENKPDRDICGVSIPDLIDHVITGPTVYPIRALEPD
jgi:hypothetical protein